MEDKLKYIINGEFINIVCNGEIYLLVDEIMYNGKLISYFNSLNNELFCYKVDNEYEVINDEAVIEDFREINNLYIDEYMYFGKFKNNLSCDFDGDLVDKKHQYLMIVYFMNNLDKVSDFDKNKVKGILDKVKFIKVDDFKGHDIGACYHVPSNSLYFKSDVNDRILFHDMLHALIGKRSLGKEILIGEGINEGAVELTTIRAFNKDISSNYSGKIFNFDTENHSYVEESAIISQLEYIMNKSINDFVINGDESIINDFYQKYGLNTYIKFRYMLNKITKAHNNGINKNISKMFSELQDFILEKVFNVEFNNIYDEKTARSYFKRLNDFGYYRGKEDIYDFKLKEYFESKKDLCSKKLNIDLNDISYVPVTFKNKYLDNDETYLSRMNVDASAYFYTHEYNEVSLYKLVKDGKYYGLLFSDGNLVLCKEYNLNYSTKVNNIEYDESELVLVSSYSKSRQR